MSFIYSIVGFLIAIGVLVAVHEFGHFWVARKLGVKVLRFSVGFGRPLWRKVAGPDNTEYVLAAIPLGGYVKMLGENDPDVKIQEHERHRAFDNQPIWKRSLIILAGPAINFLFAIVLFTLLGTQSSPELAPVFGETPAVSAVSKAGVNAGDRLLQVDGRAVQSLFEHQLYIMNRVLSADPIELLIESDGRERSLQIVTSDVPIYNLSPSSMMRQLGFVPEVPPISSNISSVAEGSPAERSGIQAGDQIISIDGQLIETWAEMTRMITPNANTELAVVVKRGRERVSMRATPEAVPFNGREIGRLGVSPKPVPYAPEQITNVDKTLLQAFVGGVDQTWQMSILTLRMLGKIVVREVSPKGINGPITIAQVTGQAIQVGLDYYLHILAVISISLGVMNLLPIPILDGGQLLGNLVELAGGKRASDVFYAVGQRIGIVVLLGFMSLAFYNDIFRLLN